jgi:hypothetical protein
MRTTRLKPSRCPFCRHKLDAVTATPWNRNATPVAGDLTVCLECAHVLVFDDDVKPRVPTLIELTQALVDPNMSRLIETIKALPQRRR